MLRGARLGPKRKAIVLAAAGQAFLSPLTLPMFLSTTISILGPEAMIPAHCYFIFGRASLMFLEKLIS